MRLIRLPAAAFGCLIACALAPSALAQAIVSNGGLLTLADPPPSGSAAALAQLALTWLGPAAGTVLTGLAAWVARWIVGHLRLQADSLAAQAILAAATRGAGLAYSALATQASHIGDQPLRNVAVGRAVGYVTTSVPGYLARLGVTPDRLQQMVEAELGKLMAADPTISIAPPRREAEAA